MFHMLCVRTVWRRSSRNLQRRVEVAGAPVVVGGCRVIKEQNFTTGTLVILKKKHPVKQQGNGHKKNLVGWESGLVLNL